MALEISRIKINGGLNAEKYLPRIKKAMNVGVANTAHDAQDNCRQFSQPTGNLKASIKPRVEQHGDHIVGTVGTNVEYAVYVEMGTGIYAKNGDGRKTPWRYKDAKDEWHTTQGQHPQPFMYPAFMKNRRDVVDFLADAVKGV